MRCSFTEAHYMEIMQTFLDAGYRFRSFTNFLPAASHQIILRHDVDLSLEDAIRISRLEARMGITSVYNFLLTAEVYNPASLVGQRVINEIRQLGHRIGLHIDPIGIKRGKDDIFCFYGEIKKMFEMARLVLGPLDSYSLHRPAENEKMVLFQLDNPPFPLPPYAYSPIYKEDILYLSDSRREWRSGCICSKVPDLRGRSLQLLLHPIWWTSRLLKRNSVLRDWFLRQQELAENYLEDNLSFYKRR